MSLALTRNDAGSLLLSLTNLNTGLGRPIPALASERDLELTVALGESEELVDYRPLRAEGAVKVE